MFTPRKEPELRVAHKGHARGQARRAKILAVVTKTPLSAREIAEKVGFKSEITNWYIRNMVMKGQLKTLGRGSATKYIQA